MSGGGASRRSSSVATAKRPAVVAAESAGVGAKAAQANKRAALGDVTNVGVEGGGRGGRAGGGSRKVSSAPAGSAASKLNSATSAAPVKKVSLASSCNVGSGRGSAMKLASTKPGQAVSRHDNTMQRQNVSPAEVPTVVQVLNVVPATALCSSIVPPPHLEDSVSTDGAMSTCDSMKSPDFEYSNNGNSSMLSSLDGRENLHLCILKDRDETKWKKNAPDPMEIDHVCAVENKKDDSQLYPSFASDIYMLLRESESKKRPSTDFMETIQKDISASMRAILIDWLVEVAEEYRLVPDTLYLTVNYIDRYLSCNKISRQRLQLLGVACMLIAAKREEICAPQAEEFCYITDNTYIRDEVLEMEASVLNCLKFETSAPTAKCFLRRFLHAARACDEDPAYIEVLANYITELSLLEYNLLCYPPSQIAASAIFLAKYILYPTKQPWNPTLARYTRYKPSELCECVKAMHRVFSIGPMNNLPAVREKYGQHKVTGCARPICWFNTVFCKFLMLALSLLFHQYKFVAKLRCPASIPTGFFEDVTC
ncbi:cyclin-A1-3 isoform X1 [Setaria italica]|uniref:cyclin-A1-3 isoform X1 n=1 Tax=Setaria italica TaxID=4555 RepID=UPI000BE4C43F|nr:cyclin-A1-3 isoform X1 [Setaria italica]